MSVAGGYDKAVERAVEAGCSALQIFTKNNNQWHAKPITREAAQAFRQALEAAGIRHAIAHDSYLINLASPDDALWKKSLDAFVDELRRADQLGLQYLVTHPGSYTSSDETQGIKRIIRALNQAHRRASRIRTRCLLENTAGQGTNLGWKFEQLAAILDGVRDPERLGVCLDTCHLFAAGYALETLQQFKKTFREFDRLIGVERIKAFHLNDSKAAIGSRVDRHERIGAGQMGLEPFRNLLGDRRFRHVPMYLETPKGEEDGRSLDEINLETLRGLVA